MAGVGADAQRRSSDEGEEAQHRWGRFPCARSSRVSAAENGPVPLPREARLSPTSGCADACGRPVEAPLTCLHAASAGACTGAALPAHALWGPPWHLGFVLCVYIFGASGASLPRARAGWSEPHPPTHGDPSRGRPWGSGGSAVRSQQGPSPQSGCRSPDVHVFLLLGCVIVTSHFFFRSPFS